MTSTRTMGRPDFRAARWLPVLCLAGGLLLAACGGGGGGGDVRAMGEPSPSPAPAPAPDPAPAPAPDPAPAPAPNPVPAPDPEPTPDPQPVPPEQLDSMLIQVTPSTPAPAPPTPTPAPAPSTPAPAPSLPTAADFARDPEYCTGTEPDCENWGLPAVRAADAYAQLVQSERAFVAPGTGVTVGLIDTGIEPLHWEFDSSRVTETILAGTGDRDGNPYSHGTMVASLIAAQRDGFVPSSLEHLDFHGIAWGAELKMFAVQLGSGSGGYSPASVEGLRGPDATVSGWLNAALAADEGIDILNMSFSVSGLIENYDGTDLEAALDDVIAAAVQSSQDDADKTLLVWAASNSHGDPCTDATLSECVEGKVVASSPAVLAGLPVHVEELRKHSVAVVATQRDGTLAGFSHRCGVAAQWCVAAPGEDLVVAYYGQNREGVPGFLGYHSSMQGTSFAAPLVAGGLAVLKQYFRGQLGNTEVLTRLYETAAVTPDTVADGEQCPEHLDLDDDHSDCELSSTHGRGLMDLDAATRPVGSMTIALGDTLSGDRVAAASSLLRSGGPAGNALSAAFRGREAAVFDALDAPFWVGLDGFARTAAEPDLEDRLARFMRPEPRRRDWAGLGAVSVPGVPGGLIEAPFASTRLRLGVNRAGGEEEWWSGGHASLVAVDDGGLSLTLGDGEFQASALAAASALHHGWEGAGPAPEPGAGVLFSWQPRSAALGMRFGALREFESALGTSASGAFGKLASGVVFAGTGFSAEVGGWGIEAGAELGVAGSEASGGIVREVSTLATSAFSLSAERAFEDGGRLRFSLSQPLRVENGRMRLAVPTGRTKRGEVVRSIVDAPLIPSGRQIDLGADWRRPVGAADGELRLGATVSFQPGHAAGRAPDLTLLAGYRLAF